MNPETHKKIIDEFNEIPWNKMSKILKTEFISSKNQLLLKMGFGGSDSLLFSVCDFVSRKSVPFSDSPGSIGRVELVLNTQKLRGVVLPCQTLGDLEDLFSGFFGRLIAPAPSEHTVSEHTKPRQTERSRDDQSRGIVSFTYDNTYFFLRIHKYAIRTLTKVNLRNAGPHMTLRLAGLTCGGRSYDVEYPNDKIKGNNVGKRYVQKDVRRCKNGRSRTVYVKSGCPKVIRDSPIKLVVKP